MSFFSKSIRAVSDIIDEAVRNVRGRISSDVSFSEYVNEIEKEAHRLYLLEEKRVVREILLKEINPESRLKDTLQKVADIVVELSTVIANTRRSRGGMSSEYILSYALKEYGIDNEPVGRRRSKKSYYPDVAIPSKEALEKNPNGVIALAVKRTLRERWREDIPIFRHFPNAAFVCLSDSADITEGKLLDMQEEGLRVLFLPDNLYFSLKGFIEEDIKRIEVYELSYLPRWIRAKLSLLR
ncbi:EcoRII-like protein [Phorcysia thermohydrogeniphila]|uniref:EcoRII-like protein n=2 Tax=Phorcysia thermohydrogeniphila TaxID=936138 RepID=A0A4R1G820_9BACT|nr:EcoRII-like protein [Phorcysia thermohydrogeniphila]